MAPPHIVRIKIEDRSDVGALITTVAVGVALLFLVKPLQADSESPMSMEAALVSASYQGNDVQVRNLLARGADVNGIYLSDTPLTRAVVGRNVTTTKLLLESGANPNQPDGLHTPLTEAAVFVGVPEIVELLLRHGVDPNLESKDMLASREDAPLCLLTASARYSESVQSEIAHLLITAGAFMDRTCPRSDNQTPLRNAVGNNKVDVAKVLLQAGANANDIDNDESPLEAAAVVANAYKDTRMAALLLDFGADPNYGNDRTYYYTGATGEDWANMSVLAVVARTGDVDTLRLLLDHGANPCRPMTEDGKTPYAIARHYFRDDAAKLIRTYQKNKCVPSA